MWRDLRKLLARAPASDLKPGKLQSIKICLDTIVDTSFWIFLTSASRKVDDTLIGKFLFKIPNSFFSWFQICRKIYRSAYSPTSSKRARSHVRGVPVCGLGEPVTSKACTHCAEFHFFWYPLTGKTMKTPQMLLPKNWWNSVMGLVNLHLKEVYWTSTWEKLSKSIQRRNIAKLEWKSVDVQSGTNHLHGFLEKSLVSLILSLDLKQKKRNAMGTPTRLRWLFASHLHQPTKLPRPATAMWQGMAFPMAILNQPNQRPATFHHQQHATPTKALWLHSLAFCQTHTIIKKNQWPKKHAVAFFFLRFFFSPKQTSGDVLKSQVIFPTLSNFPKNQRMDIKGAESPRRAVDHRLSRPENSLLGLLFFSYTWPPLALALASLPCFKTWVSLFRNFFLDRNLDM